MTHFLLETFPGFLAHGSGIDDMLWFAIPAALAILVVRRAERRAARKGLDQTNAIESEPSDGTRSQPESPQRDQVDAEPLSSDADE